MVKKQNAESRNKNKIFGIFAKDDDRKLISLTLGESIEKIRYITRQPLSVWPLPSKFD